MAHRRGAGKECAICRDDCSRRARVKDRAGRYYCRECYEDAVLQLRRRRQQRYEARMHREADRSSPTTHAGLQLMNRLLQHSDHAPGWRPDDQKPRDESAV